MNQRKMEQGVRLLLQGMEVDLNDRNFKDTPRRVARMYKELFTPSRNNFKTFKEDHDELILLRNHLVFAICPHHLLPVEMHVFVGYIPKGTVLGLSKLARVAESPLTGPILQEVYTRRVADDIWRHLQPQGVGVVTVATHGCMRCRGVRTTGDIVTSAMKGVMLTNPAARGEMLSLIGRV